jgi:O-antigen ligase
VKASVFALTGKGDIEDARVMMDLFLRNPLFGIGIGNFPFYIPAQKASITVSSAGSMYIGLLIELGLVGTVLFLTFIGAIVFNLAKVIRRSRNTAIRNLAIATFLSIIMVMIQRNGTGGGLFTDHYL